MTAITNTSICGLLSQDVIAVNDTAAFISDVVLAAVNVPLCVFAFLSNLVAIVAVVKTPDLHKPCNIVLCSLAFADCLSGVISQPLFIARRLMLHRTHISCDYQLEVYLLHRCFTRLSILLSFVNLTVISFDRHYALSKPLQYRADASNSDATKRAVLAGASVALFVVPTEFVLTPSNPLLVPHLIIGAFVILTPIINHLRMFIAIRQHRHQVAGAVTSNQQLNMILRREKKVAFDMFIVSIVLLVSFAPLHVIKVFESSSFLASTYRYLFPWALSASFMSSYANPIIYFWRNKKLRTAMKSTVSC